MEIEDLVRTLQAWLLFAAIQNLHSIGTLQSFTEIESSLKLYSNFFTLVAGRWFARRYRCSPARHRQRHKRRRRRDFWQRPVRAKPTSGSPKQSSPRTSRPTKLARKSFTKPWSKLSATTCWNTGTNQNPTTRCWAIVVFLQFTLNLLE